MRVAYPTTPAQYFHLLRRQAHAVPERPLVVMTPKSLLRLPAASSPAAELSDRAFQAVLDDPTAESRRDSVRRLVLCSGKFYYDLSESDHRKQAADVAVARVEQLYPFPVDELDQLVRRYPALEEVVWAQEEPRNMGALSFVGPRLRIVVPRTIALTEYSRPFSSARKIVGIGAPGGMTKVVLRPSSEIETGAKAARRRPRFRTV